MESGRRSKAVFSGFVGGAKARTSAVGRLAGVATSFGGVTTTIGGVSDIAVSAGSSGGG